MAGSETAGCIGRLTDSATHASATSASDPDAGPILQDGGIGLLPSYVPAPPSFRGG